MEIQPLIILGEIENLISSGKSKISQISPGITEENIIIIQNQETSSIGIDQIKALISTSSRSALTGTIKAYIIEAHRLTEEAQNALLKILEEPPSDTIFVLTTNNLDLILPTVISRCQIIFDEEEKNKTEDFENISALLASDPPERLEEIDKQIDVKEQIDKTQKYLLRLLRDYCDSPIKTKTCIESLMLVENSRQMCEANVARDAVWESLLLNLPKISKNL